MSAAGWRDGSRRAIAQALANLPAGATEQEREKAIRSAYPFGERKYYPYKIWLVEVRNALGRGPKAKETICDLLERQGRKLQFGVPLEEQLFLAREVEKHG